MEGFGRDLILGELLCRYCVGGTEGYRDLYGRCPGRGVYPGPHYTGLVKIILILMDDGEQVETVL